MATNDASVSYQLLNSLNRQEALLKVLQAQQAIPYGTTSVEIDYDPVYVDDAIQRRFYSGGTLLRTETYTYNGDRNVTLITYS